MNFSLFHLLHLKTLGRLDWISRTECLEITAIPEMLGLQRLRRWNEVLLAHSLEAAEGNPTPIPDPCEDDAGVYLRCLHHIGNLEATCRTPGCRGDILRDITRTFPSHPFFALPSSLSGKEWNNTILPKTHGVEMLRHVLLALATARPDIGYCQGMNFVVGVLLLVGSLHNPAPAGFVSTVSETERNGDIRTWTGRLLDAAIPNDDDDEDPESENQANDSGEYKSFTLTSHFTLSSHLSLRTLSPILPDE